MTGGEPTLGYRPTASVAGALFEELLATTPTSDLSIDIGSLVDDTHYVFKVHSINLLGVGNYSTGSIVIRTLPVFPMAPAPPEVMGAGRFCLLVNWSAPTFDGGSTLYIPRRRDSLVA